MSTMNQMRTRVGIVSIYLLKQLIQLRLRVNLEFKFSLYAFFHAIGLGKFNVECAAPHNKKLQTDVSRGVHLHECSFLAFYHANGPRMKRG